MDSQALLVEIVFDFEDGDVEVEGRELFAGDEDSILEPLGAYHFAQLAELVVRIEVSQQLIAQRAFPEIEVWHLFGQQ